MNRRNFLASIAALIVSPLITRKPPKSTTLSSIRPGRWFDVSDTGPKLCRVHPASGSGYSGYAVLTQV